MFTPTVTPINHNGCSPHAPTPRPAVKRRIILRVLDGHAYAVDHPVALKPSTFIRI